MISLSFLRGGRNSTLSSEGSPHEALQSGQGGGRGSNTTTSHQVHDGRGGAGLCDGSVVKEGSSIKVIIVDRGVSFLLKMKLIP